MKASFVLLLGLLLLAVCSGRGPGPSCNRLPGAMPVTASNNVNFLPHVVSSNPFLVTRVPTRLSLDAQLLQTTMVQCDFVAHGFGRVLINFVAVDGSVASALWWVLPGSAHDHNVTFSWSNTNQLQIATIVVTTLNGMVTMQTITAQVSISTAFAPGSIYRYSLVAESASDTLNSTSRFSPVATTATQLISTFDVTALPYTLEAGCVTLLIQPSKVNITCINSGSGSSCNHSALANTTSSMPDVYITQNITTGLFSHFFVANITAQTDNDTASFYLDTALFAMHLMHWNKACQPSNLSIVDHSHAWSSIELHPKSIHVVYNSYKLHLDGLGFLRSRGVQHPTGRIRAGSSSRGPPHFDDNGPCVELQATFTDPSQSPYASSQNQLTDNYNSTVFTCFDPLAGPTFSYMNQTGRLVGTNSTDAVKTEASMLLPGDLESCIIGSLEGGFSIIHAGLDHSGQLFASVSHLQSSASVEHSAFVPIDPIRPESKHKLVSVKFVTLRQQQQLWAVSDHGDVYSATIAADSAAGAVWRSPNELLPATTRLVMDAAANVAGSFQATDIELFFRPLSGYWEGPTSPKTIRTAVAVAKDTVGHLHVAHVVPSLNGTVEGKLEDAQWCPVLVRDRQQQDHTVSDFTEFHFLEPELVEQPSILGVALSDRALYLLQSDDADPSARSASFPHVTWSASALRISIRDAQDELSFSAQFPAIWQFHADVLRWKSRSLLSITALVSDHKLAVASVSPQALESGSSWDIVDTDVRTFVPFAKGSSHSGLLWLLTSGRLRCAKLAIDRNNAQSVKLSHHVLLPFVDVDHIHPVLSTSPEDWMWLHFRNGTSAIVQRVRGLPSCRFELVSKDHVDLSSLRARPMKPPSRSTTESMPSQDGSGAQLSYGGSAFVQVVLQSTRSVQADIDAASGHAPARIAPILRTNLPVVRPSPAWSIFPHMLLMALPPPAPVMTNSTAKSWLQSIINNATDTATLFGYRNAVQASGEQAVETIVSLCLSGETSCTAVFFNENVTAVVLSPLVDMLPPSLLASKFIYTIASNDTLPLAVRSSAIRQSWAMQCPDPELNAYLQLLSNFTYVNSTGIDLTLWADASYAFSIFASRACDVSLASRLRYSREQLAALESGAGVLQDSSKRLQRLLTVPCPAHLCGSHGDKRAILRQSTMELHEANATDLVQVGIAGLGNIRRPDHHEVHTVAHFLHHEDGAVRTTALRSVRRFTQHLHLYRQQLQSLITYDSSSAVRSAAVATLLHISHSARTNRSTDHEMASATQWIVHRLHKVHHDYDDLAALRQYFRHRALAGGLDAPLARVAHRRVAHLVQTASNAGVGDERCEGEGNGACFVKTFGMSQASVEVNAALDWLFDENGFSSQALTSVDAKLFDQEFNLAKAGATASWNSGGDAGAFVYFVIHALAFDDHGFPGFWDYDILLLQRTIKLPGLSFGDVCSLSLPPSVGYTTRVQQTFYQFKFMYGIPILADLELSVSVVGWFNVDSGVVFVFSNPPSLSNMTVKGYVSPSVGIDAQVSAGGHIMFLAASLRGTLTFAQLELPVIAAYSVLHNQLGYDIQLTGKFLQGRVALQYTDPIPHCHWVSKWWGGYPSCSFVDESLTLFDWSGFQFSRSLLDHPMCSGFSYYSHNRHYKTGDECQGDECWPLEGKNEQQCCQKYIWPHPYNTRLQARLQQAFLRDYDAKACAGGEPGDDDACLIWWADKTWATSEPDASTSSTRVERYALVKLQSRYHYLKHSAFQPYASFEYLCDSAKHQKAFPKVCANTYCFFKYVMGVAPQTTTVTVTRAVPASINRRKSLGGLRTMTGMDRDEVPMASWAQVGKWTNTGCAARIEAIDPKDNRRHGGLMGKYYSANNIAGGDSFQIDLTQVFSTSAVRRDVQQCCNDEYRLQELKVLRDASCNDAKPLSTYKDEQGKYYC